MPKQVGDFEIIRDLGEGAFSKVKLAVNVKTGQKVAIKIISRENLHGKLKENFKSEMNIMFAMDHPGIIKLIHVMRSEKHMFLVLEYAEGGELFTQIAKNGKLDENTSRNYFQQLIDALDFMHLHNTAHRDLKPENLLLDAEGHLKVADFGLSKMSNTKDALLKTRCGTPNYVAPEVFIAEGYQGAPADIWSSGVILYVMLTGNLPFQAKTLQELIGHISNLDIIYPSDMPKGAIFLLQKIFVTDPVHRATIEQIRQDPWFSVNYNPILGKADLTNELTEVNVKETPKPKEPEVHVEVDDMNAFELIAKIGSIDMAKIVDSTLPADSSTTFSTNLTSEEAFANLQNILNAFKAQYNVREGNVIKAECNIGGNLVKIRVGLSCVTQGVTLIEISRLKGDQFSFMRFFRQIKVKMMN